MTHSDNGVMQSSAESIWFPHGVLVVRPSKSKDASLDRMLSCLLGLLIDGTLVGT